MEYMTANQVASHLGLTVHQVYRRMRRGDLKFFTDGPARSAYYVRPADLDAYIAAGAGLSKPKKDTTWMSVSEVAFLLGFTDETVRRLCKEGRWTVTRGTGRNGHWRILRSSVEMAANPPEPDDMPGIAKISRDFF